MKNTFWRLTNLTCGILAIAALLLQVVAVASSSWKIQDVYLDRFDAGLPDLVLRRRLGLFKSYVYIIGSGFGMHGLVVGNKFPMVKDQALLHCTNGPTFRYQLSVCDMPYQMYDCRCKYFDHWIAVVVLQICSLPFVALQCILCLMLRSCRQKFVKTTCLLVSIITTLILLAGFIMVFQYWELEYAYLARVLPYYLNTIRIEYGLPALQVAADQVLRPYDMIYTGQNTFIRAGWSTFVSLGALLASLLLVFPLILSLILQMRVKKTQNYSPRNNSAQYRSIEQQQQ